MSEPWLRGIKLDADPASAASVFALRQAGEDIVAFTEGIPDAQIWDRPSGLSSIGFQLRHIAGSLDRLGEYLAGRELTGTHLAALRAEHEPGASRAELLTAAQASLARAEKLIRDVPPREFGAPRFIGRKRIETTAIGLIIHMAEHTQRHVGQLIVLCRLSSSLPPPPGTG